MPQNVTPNRRPRAHTLTALAIPVGLLLLFGGALALVLWLRENPHVRRAEKMLEQSDYEGAETELRTAMAQGVTDPHAKALLLYAVLKNGPSDDEESPPPPPPPQVMPTPDDEEEEEEDDEGIEPPPVAQAPASAPAPTFVPFEDDNLPGFLGEAGRLRFAANEQFPQGMSEADQKVADHALTTGIGSLRQDLENRGVQTEDASDLYSVTLDLARFTFRRADPQTAMGSAAADDPDSDSDDEGDDDLALDRLAAAYALADAGDASAAQALVDALGSKRADDAQRFLERLGPDSPAMPLLQNMKKDAFGRDRALAILSKVMVAHAAAEVLEREQGGRSCQADDLPEALQTDTIKAELGDHFSAAASRLYIAAQVDLEVPLAPDFGTVYQPLGTPDNGLLAVYGCSDKESAFTYLFQFDGRDYKDVKVGRDGREESNVTGQTPVLKVVYDASASNVELWQPAVIPSENEKPQGSLLTTPKVGDRVWVASIAIAGSIASISTEPPDDEGDPGETTYTITLDQPYDGSTTYWNAEEYDLQTLKKVKEDVPGDDIDVGALADGVLSIKPELHKQQAAPTPVTTASPEYPPEPEPDEIEY
jgi:hypothetical protein